MMPRQFVLLGCAAALAGYLLAGHTAVSPPAGGSIPPVAADAAPAPRDPPATVGTAPPIFGRRIVLPDAGPAIERPAARSWRLVGVLTGGDGPTALLAAEDDPVLRRVSPGDRVDEASVIAIDARSLLLETRDGRIRLELDPPFGRR